MKPPSAKFIKQAMAALIEQGIDKEDVVNFIFYVSTMKEELKMLKKAVTTPPKGFGPADGRMWFTHATDKVVERLVKLIA